MKPWMKNFMLAGAILCASQFAQSKTYQLPQYIADEAARGNQNVMVEIAAKFDPDVDDTDKFNKSKFMFWSTINNQPKDINIALEWYKKAADLGNEEAKNALGRLYFKQKDYTSSFYWLETRGGKKTYFLYSLASDRFFDPYGAVGWMYQKGLGTVKNYEKAIENYEEIPDGSDDRIYFLKAELEGRNTNLGALQIAASQGDIDAMRLLAIWYQHYSIQDYQGYQNNNLELLKQARYWYKKVEEKTLDPEVQYFIAMTIPYKEEKARVERFQWLKKSADADNGYSYAKLEVGRAFSMGYGTIRDKEQAKKYGKLACEAGIDRGCYFYNSL